MELDSLMDEDEQTDPMNEEDEEEVRDREKILGFKPQKEIRNNKFLPYSHLLDDESNKFLAQIKGNLGKAVLLRDMDIGSRVWALRLLKYFRLYGFKFSKEDHISFIKILYDLIIIPDLESPMVAKYATILSELLSKPELIDRTELEIQWRPLYEIRRRIIEKSHCEVGLRRNLSNFEGSFNNLIHSCKYYFPVTATKEILEEFLPKLCPIDASCIKCVYYLHLFLPVNRIPDLEVQPYELWFNDLMNKWQKYCVCESDTLWLMAHLANLNIGYIDWEPYLPFIFTRFQRSLNLPVFYKKNSCPRIYKLDQSSIALWIVSTLGGNTSTVIYLENLLKTIESYVQPANYGRWVASIKNLLKRIVSNFISRVHRERIQRKTWKPKVPDSHKLTDDDITKFVELLQPIVLQTMYTKGNTLEMLQTLQSLATLRPSIVIPPIVERTYFNISSLTEPHKLTASLISLLAVLRPMLEKQTGPGAAPLEYHYIEGPSHILPILMAVLPGIDPNDTLKSCITFQVLTSIIGLVSIVNCSDARRYWNDLTDDENLLCRTTMEFEDFFVQFLGRIFNFIEGSAIDQVRHEQQYNKYDNEPIQENGFLNTLLTVVLTQTSEDIAMIGLKKLKEFVMGRILETSVAGVLLSQMCASFANIYSEQTLHALLPALCENIMKLTESEEALKEPQLDNELSYKLLLISELVDCDGDSIVKYMPVLQPVIDRVIKLRSKEGQRLTGKLISNIIISLTHLGPDEYRSVNYSFNEPLSEHLPIRDWGQPINISDLKVNWTTLTDERYKCLNSFIQKYLSRELNKLELFINDEIKLPREDLQSSLNIIIAILSGKPYLPVWDEPELKWVDTQVDFAPFVPIHGLENYPVTMPDGSNMRKAIANVIFKLQNKLLNKHEDDVRSLLLMINIYESILWNQGESKIALDILSRNLGYYKQILHNKLSARGKNLRKSIIDKVFYIHKRRVEEGSISKFTSTHRDILFSLYQLAISQYSEVRAKAQSCLNNTYNSFTFAYRFIIPKLVETLTLDSNENHEQFKGALYCLMSPKPSPFIIRQSWEVLSQLWITLVNSKPSEKPSVIKLIESIQDLAQKSFPTINIILNVSDSNIKSASQLWNTSPKPLIDIPNEIDIKNGAIKLKEIEKKKLNIYHDMINSLLDSIENGNLNWRFQTLASVFLRLLCHPEVDYPPRAIKYMLQLLNHDLIELRKLSLTATTCILVQQRRKKNKVYVDPFSYDAEKQCVQIISENELIKTDAKLSIGTRSDNIWLQYNSKTKPQSKEDWDKLRFINKTHIGFNGWPQHLQLYAPPSEQASLDVPADQLTPGEIEVDKFFSSVENIDKWIIFLSLEDKKGKDRFSSARYVLFKYLFRNFGDKYLDLFKPHLQRLVDTKLEQSQRCASEIIAGLIKGSKSWPYDKVDNLWKFLIPVLSIALSNLTSETVSDWGTCFATSSENRDPNKHHFLLEFLMEDPLKQEAAFNDCGRLYALQGAINQHSWRVSELFYRLLNYLKPFLTHPFQNVRERIGSVLTTIFQADFEEQDDDNCDARSPHVRDFIAEIMLKLEILYQDGPKLVDPTNQLQNAESDNDKSNEVDTIEKKEAINTALTLIKTICRWACGNVSRSFHGAKVEFYQLFPLACLLESYEGDDEIKKSCNAFLANLSFISLTSNKILPLFAAIDKTLALGSWRARATCLDFLQTLVFHNMPVFTSNSEWVKKIIDIVLKLLKDERLEVREKAAQVVGGLLHCNFISSPDTLLRKFTKLSRTRLRRNEVVDTYSTETIIQRHSGVLGLCAFIDAYPYYVPDFVPQVFSTLGDHLNDPPPISTTIRKTLGNFKRTHHDNWEADKLKFTEDQLTVLTDLLVPPSYYA